VIDMQFKAIKYETQGPLAWISLNRPEKLNAINAEMVRELNRALDMAEQDDTVRVILLNGEGRAFSAGFDLVMDGDGNDVEAIGRELRAGFDIIMRFWDCPKPTIAAVHGYCLGSGMEMAVACDVTLAAEGCRFGAPEVKFGSGIVALILPWVCGPKRAKELLLTGNDRVDSHQAEAWGLVNHVVAPDELQNRALEMGREIARNDSLAVRLTKEAINSAYEIPGMRNALLHALDLDVVVETTETEESRQFNEILEKDGAKAAIKWRVSQVTCPATNDL
jgi:enoyl-CoA hydratase